MRNIQFILLIAVILSACSQQNMEEANRVQDITIVSKDVHTYAKPDEAVVKHLDWEALVNFDEKKISATARLEIRTKGDASALQLDTKDLDIKSVSDNDGNALDFELGDNDSVMGRKLTIPISRKTKAVNISYETSSEAEALQWLDPIQTAGKEYPFLFTQSQAILARSWIPLQDSPGIRFTYTAKVTVPKGLLALMSAENPVEVDSTGVYTFRMEQPIPAYLMALAVGNLQYDSISERTGVYAEPVTLEAALYEFAEMDDMLKAAEKLYGTYRWDQYDVLVLPPSFPFGGMENPRLTFATPTILTGDRSLTSLIAHELAHSWSGNLVTNATWNDFWLNEGFTVYFEYRIMEALYGKSYAEMLAKLSLADLKEEVKEMRANGQGADTRLKLDLTGRNPDEGVTTIAYDKGYFFLRSLENLVGREKWDAFLKQYFSDNAFQSTNTDYFIQYANQYLFAKNDLEIPEKIYRQWIYEEGLPENMPIVNSDRFTKVENTLSAWQDGEALDSLDTEEWTSHEWLHFVRSIPDSVSQAEMYALDQVFNFTNSGNSEILGAWFVKAIEHDYRSAYGAMETFLVNTGRRKFLTPIYGELIKTTYGKQLALSIYKKARPNYHFVSYNTLDSMLGWKP